MATFLHALAFQGRLPRNGSLLTTLRNMQAVAHQRAALAKLSDAELADIGLTRKDAQIEANRPVWDLPATARC